MFMGFLAVVIVLMICILLAPEATNSVLLARVPKDVRPAASRLAPVPVIVIFVCGAFMFASMKPPLAGSARISLDPMQNVLLPIGGFIFLLAGVSANLWPMWFMRRSVPRLRTIDAAQTDARSERILVAVARCFGVMFLLAAAFLLRRWFE